MTNENTIKRIKFVSGLTGVSSQSLEKLPQEDILKLAKFGLKAMSLESTVMWKVQAMELGIDPETIRE